MADRYRRIEVEPLTPGIGCRRPAARQQAPEQLLVERVRLRLVHPRQRRPGHRADPEVVQLAALRRQVRHDVAQAAAPGELPHRHRHELVPARHAAQPAALVVPFRDGLELMSRHQLEKLRENRAIVGHGLNILVSD